MESWQSFSCHQQLPNWHTPWFIIHTCFSKHRVRRQLDGHFRAVDCSHWSRSQKSELSNESNQSGVNVASDSCVTQSTWNSCCFFVMFTNQLKSLFVFVFPSCVSGERRVKLFDCRCPRHLLSSRVDFLCTVDLLIWSTQRRRLLIDAAEWV